MKKYILIFIFASAIFLSHYAFSGQAVWGDGIDYWVYLPSLYFDHDINFENQYRHTYSPENNNRANPRMAPIIVKANYTSIGKVGNPHLPGLAILWFPAFFVADIFSLILKLPRLGYSNAYQIACGLWSVAITMLGLILSEKLVYKFIKNHTISFVSTMAVFLASPLLYYGSFDILNSHFASFFLASLFWYLLFVKYNNSKHAAAIGAVVGLATIVRPQNSLLILLALIYIYWKKRKLLPVDSKIMLIFFIIFISPMLFVWSYLYGQPAPASYVAFWNFKFEYLGSLTHPINGLFSRTPILLVSLLGAGQFVRKFKKEFLLMFSFFIIQFIVISLHGGWIAASYGGRMYTATLPFFIVCLSFLLIEVKKRWSWRLALLIVSFFVILNFVSIGSFVLFEKEVNSGKKRGLEEATQARFERIIENTKK